MYQLVKFLDTGHARITNTEKPFKADYKASSGDEATLVVNRLNAEYSLPILAAHRYTVETGGVIVGGSKILTDRGSQAQLNSALQALTSGFVTAVDWKANGQWISITLAAIQPIAAAVAQHVQRCFTAERQVAEQIQAGNLTPDQVVAAYDAALAALVTPAA